MNLTQQKNTLCEWLYSLQNLHLWMSGHDHFLEYFRIMECIILETWVHFLDLFLSGYDQVFYEESWDTYKKKSHALDLKNIGRYTLDVNG